MIPTTVKTEVVSQFLKIGPVVPVSPVTATPDALQSTPDLTLGQKYQAVISARLANGNAKVFIAGQFLQMHFPGKIPAGDTIELVFLAKEPQLKFFLQNHSSQDSTTQNPAIISAAGRLLGALVKGTQPPTATQPATNTTPVLAQFPVNSAKIPALLQQALSQSGLFYESHQAQWLLGKKTLEQLKQEPQAKLTSLSAPAAAGINTESPMHTQSLALIMQQLTILETNQLVWRGEIWPKQWLKWQVSPDHDRQDKATRETPPTQWKTKLHLTLPKLGKVTAALIFNSRTLSIELCTGNIANQVLRDNQSLLTTAMSLTGLHVQSVEILNKDDD